MPDLRHSSPMTSIVVPEGPGCCQCSSHHWYRAKLSDFFRQAVAFWWQKPLRKGDVHQIPIGQPNTNGWFVAESASFRWFPLVRFADSQQLRPLQGSKRPGGIGAGHTWREFSGNNTGKVRTPGHAIECQAFPISKVDMLGQLWLKMFPMWGVANLVAHACRLSVNEVPPPKEFKGASFWYPQCCQNLFTGEIGAKVCLQTTIGVYMWRK